MVSLGRPGIAISFIIEWGNRLGLVRKDAWLGVLVVDAVAAIYHMAGFKCEVEL